MAHSATSAMQHSYLDVFGDRLPSRFPVPEEAAESSRPKPSAKCFIEPSPSNPIRVPLRKKVKCFFTDVWNTRISMKLFGSRKELEMEEERLQNIEYLVIHPCSKFRSRLHTYVANQVAMHVCPVYIAFYYRCTKTEFSLYYAQDPVGHSDAPDTVHQHCSPPSGSELLSRAHQPWLALFHLLLRHAIHHRHRPQLLDWGYNRRKYRHPRSQNDPSDLREAVAPI